MIFTYTYPNDFWHKRKIDHFDPYCWLLLTMLLMTGFVVQGPKWYFGVELFL